MAIQFVGAVSAASPDAAGTALTLDLTALTGGIDTVARHNDIVLFIHAGRGGGSSVNQDMGATTSGYSEIDDLFADDSDDMNLAVSWKRMGATPDTSVASTGVPLRTVAIAYVLRGVDITTALDVTSVVATGTNSGVAVPGTITPVTEGSLIVVVWANISSATTAITAPFGYDNFVTKANTSLTSFPHIGVGTKAWTSGTETPGFCGNITSSINFAWAAMTIALRMHKTSFLWAPLQSVQHILVR